MRQQIASNVAAVRERIAEAARRNGRRPEDIRLVAVVKYADVESTRMLVECGCWELGESRPQDLWHKAQALSDAGHALRWHLVGHLQRNKVRRTLPLVHMIHSGDSLRLLRTIDQQSAAAGLRMPVLIEVNISGDETKHGFAPGQIEREMGAMAALKHLDICGLMAMASREGGRVQARRDFANLRRLRDQLAGSCPDPMRLTELSMGMSSDFEEAIAEGATIVRIGSMLFEEHPR